MADYILLPRSGVLARDDEPTAALMRTMASARSTQPALAASLAPTGGGPVEVVDSAGETGPKLVRMTNAEAVALNAASPDIRAAPVVIYKTPGRIPYQAKSAPTSAGTAAPAAGPPLTTFTIRCREAVTHTPMPGCTVIAFDNFALLTGAQGVTDANGEVTLTILGGMIDRLFVYSAETHWGAHRAGVPVVAGGVVIVDIEPVNLAFVDAVRHYYPATRFVPGAGVKVGVIDTGVGPHTHLNILAGSNTVTGEPAGDTGDWYGHGTHVAGLIGANGAAAGGLRGVSPGVGIVPLRVFGAGVGGASNYAILKAMIKAAAFECDIVNLSLGGGPYDPIVAEAILDARNQGILVVIAAGNDGRQAVSYPAAYPGAIAVSAMGRDGTFPAGSVYEGDVERPPFSTPHPDEFIAAFSNVGPEVRVTGLGVGVLSSLPGNALTPDPYGPMSGTSMAAPVVAGAAASLLSQNPAIVAMPRNAARAAAIENLLLANCSSRGFGANYEGHGLPDPAVV